MGGECDFMTLFTEPLPDFFIRFKRWCNTHNLRQIDAAEQLNITRSHLNKVLNERTAPSIKLLEAMVKLMED